MDYFYIDISKNQHITWDVLINDLHNTHEYNTYCYNNDFYIVFKQILLSLLLEKDIVLLDSDFSHDEIIRLIGKTSIGNKQTLSIDRLLSITSKKDLVDEIKNVSGNWSLTLFTSGTTGIPKKIKHSFQSITRFIKTSNNSFANIWGFAYNPTHMAGILVFFQALLNENTIVRLFGLTNSDIFKSIDYFQITNISATPTFYRLLMPHSNSYSSVKRITLGGEKFDEKIAEQLKAVFPKSKITNIYASTEAGSLFAANNNVFSVKPEMQDYVKILDGELLIHKFLMGNTEFLQDDWYYTGDVVHIISNDPLQFTFINRKNEMINVGGYKVNPVEVEEIIRNINNVKNARVFSKKNSVLGNLLICEVIKTSKDLDEKTIRLILQTKLQEYKIPRIFKFVEEISTTRTGKVKRT